MDTTVRIIAVGKITKAASEPIDWTVSPLVETQDEDANAIVDAEFDAPCAISFFDHLIGCCAEVQTDTNMLVSRYMNRHGFLDMQSNYYLDGWWAATEGQPLAAMPTEYHEAGWWSASMPLGERDKFDGSIEDDHAWIRGGC